MDKVLSSDYSNGHWFDADWLHSKRYALSRNQKVDGSRLTRSSQTFQYDMETRTLVKELRRRATKKDWSPVVTWIAGQRFLMHSAKVECGFSH